MNKPFAAAAEQNRDVIFDQLKHELAPDDLVLEIGSGTGQHVSHFAQQLPSVRWQPSDVAATLSGIDSWVADAAVTNVLPAIALDVREQPWPISQADICYTANTLHIMSAEACEQLFHGCASVLPAGGKLCVYGPFSIDGEHSSESNQRFDQMLRLQDPDSGVRDLTQLDAVAQRAGFLPSRRVTMPVNNLFVVWERVAATS